MKVESYVRRKEKENPKDIIGNTSAEYSLKRKE